MAKLKTGLSQRALLVSLNISQWVGRKMDKRATNTANTAHRADASAGSYTKKLLPGAEELEKVNALAAQARKFFYENTLPWMSDGTRIISSKNYLKFVEGMRKTKDEFSRAVKDFEAEYPRLKAEAVKRLGDLHDPEDYPENIGAKFSMQDTYLPLPDAKDFRVEISEAERREFQRKMKEVESQAMRECWSRLRDVVKTASDRLANPDAIFRDSLIENIKEVAALMPLLDISTDSKLDDARREVEAIVKNLSPDVLRDNRGERDKASKALKDIESRMALLWESRNES